VSRIRSWPDIPGQHREFAWSAGDTPGHERQAICRGFLTLPLPIGGFSGESCAVIGGNTADRPRRLRCPEVGLRVEGRVLLGYREAVTTLRERPACRPSGEARSPPHSVRGSSRKPAQLAARRSSVSKQANWLQRGSISRTASALTSCTASYPRSACAPLLAPP